MRISNAHSSQAIAAQRYGSTQDRPTSVGAKSAAGGDELLLSAESQSLSEQVTTYGLNGIAPGLGPIRVEDIRGQHQMQMADLQGQLQQLFAERGLESPPEIRLQLAADGRVTVAGDHPQKDEIEALFAESPQLRNSFAQVDAQASFLRAVDESMAFQEAYREDPLAAVEQFSHLFDGSEPPQFSLLMQGNQFETIFGPA